MQSLTAHFREVEWHDRLPFHPSCPICRQTRSSGTIPAGQIVSPRTQAVLAAGLLALPAVAPTASAFAAEPDQQQEGTAPVAETAPSDPAGNPDFDPGGDTTDLPEAGAPAPQTQAPTDEGDDDGGPVEDAPATNPDEPVVDPGDGSGAPLTQQPAAPDGATPPDTSVTAPTPTPTPPETTTGAAPVPPAAPDAPALATTPPAAQGPQAGERAKQSPRHEHARPARPASGEHRAAPTVAVAAAPPTSTTVVAAAVTAVRGDRAKPGDRTHVVLAGESLWAIASDLLGSEATPAEVAREVHRMWQLNRDRIGTGDPDLLMTGTKLVLR
jgi:hypothetical protein